MDNYPPGAANDPRAPYNQKEPELVDVEVTVSVTYSKTFKVRVEEDHTDKDLRDKIEELELLPKQVLERKADDIQEDIDSNAWLFSGYNLEMLKEEMSNLRGWHEDEFEVIENG